MASEKLPTQFSVTSSDNAGLRMKIAIPRAEPHTGPSSQNALKGRVRRKKRPPASGTSSSSDLSSDSSDEDDNLRSPKRKGPLRQSSARTSASTARKYKRSSSSSSSDFDAFSGNGKRTSGRPKIRPVAVSTPAVGKVSTPAPLADATPVKRRPGRPPKKPANVSSKAVNNTAPSRVSEVRLSLADGGSSTDNDASLAISAAINRVFESGASDSDQVASGSLLGKGSSAASASKKSSKPVLSPVQYSSSLLRDFVEKTQKLGQQQEANVIVPDQTANSLPRECSASNWELPNATATPSPSDAATVVRKKRGRPPKKPPVPTPLNDAPVPAGLAKADRLNSRLKLSMRDSPDSGILSVNQSPSHSPRPFKRAPPPATVAPNRSQGQGSSQMLLSLEKPIFPTERVLYPPRNIKRGRPSVSAKQSLPGSSGKCKERSFSSGFATDTGRSASSVDPMWRRIDINKKFQRPTNGYKSDGGFDSYHAATVNANSGYRGAEGSSAVCSKVLAAQCGYASDYGSVRKSRQSGYRSDYSTKSRKSGYRSDYSTKGGCGYRSDCSVRKKLRRKRRPKASGSAGGALDHKEGEAFAAALHRNSYAGIRSRPTVAFDERDLLKLAGLSLGNSSSDDSENESPVVVKVDQQKKEPVEDKKDVSEDFMRKLASPLRKPVETFAGVSSQFEKFNKARFERDFIMNYRALVAESRQETEALEAKINEEAKARLKKVNRAIAEGPKYNCFESFSNVLPIIELKSKRSAKSIRSRRSSAVSRCSSRSNRSMHHKHRRKRLKSKSESGASNKLAEKIRLQLEQIIEMFGRACKLIDLPVIKAQKSQVQRPSTPVAAGKEKEKEREREKETPRTMQKRGMKKRKCSENADHTGTPSTSKRRGKKGQDDQSPDDHKLPLKKRHYLLTDAEKEATEKANKESGSGDVASDSKTSGTAKGKSSSDAKSLASSAGNHSEIPTTPRGSKKSQSEQVDKKKKSSAATGATVSPVPARGRPPKNAAAVPVGKSIGDNKLLSPVPPPGVFEPTMDLELQIPISTIVISANGKAGGLLTVRTKSEKGLDSPSLKKKRKKINRTGFPTVKKKKKKCPTPVAGLLTGVDIMPDIKLEKCDRVPTDGEATSKFLERSDLKRTHAVVSVERLQEPEVLNTRASRSKDSPLPKGAAKGATQSREPSKEAALASPGLPRAAKKAKIEKEERDKDKEKVKEKPKSTEKETVKECSPEAKKKRGAPVKAEAPEAPPALPKRRGRRAASTERSSEGEKPPPPERRISLLEEISPNKRQSIRHLAKSLLEAESAPKTEDIVKVPTAPPKKIDPKKRRMTVAVLESSKVTPVKRTPPPIVKQESPTALKDIKPAPSVTDLEQDALPVEEDEEEEIARTDTPSSEISDRSNSTKRGPKWKKKYLPAGLFSEYYKEGDKDRSAKANQKEGGTEGASTPVQVLLPPPPYCEKFFRQTETDFQLPYDLWFAHDSQKLPGRDAVASWTFKKIRTNVYSEGKPNPKTDLPSCNCKPNSGCADDCLNRMVYTECNPDTCPCEDKCQNTKIQRHEFAPGIERFMTEKKGWGVRTKQAIKKSQFIIEYLGEVVTERTFKERMGAVYANDTHHYCLHLDGDLVIDGHRMGSDCRFVNHSCTPNCEVQKWNVNGLSRMCLFALRDIKPGEELTYDYNFSLYNPSEGQPCKCDSKDCRGVIGGKSQRITKVEPVEEPSKSTRNRKQKAKKKNQSVQASKVRPTTPLFQIPTGKEICIIRESHCFLMRNLLKVRKHKDVTPAGVPATVPVEGSAPTSSALRRTRAVKTPDETDAVLVQLRLVFLKICAELLESKCEANELLMTLPPKKKLPKYYEKFERPIDLTTIHANADKWVYNTVKAFDEDMMRMLKNAMEFFEEKSEERAAAEALQKLYEEKKWAEYPNLATVVVNKELISEFEPPVTNELELKVEPNEDIIRCICGLFKDEGVMIECAKCQVWQHAECTKADLTVENYLCERCEPREVDLEITQDEYSEEGYQYYLSLMRGNLQIRQTDTVYVLRDIPMSPAKDDPEKKVRKHTYETIGKIDYGDCDIFRVERLWKDKEGKRFVFGHHYLRPHETYHEPSRKFYPNEVVRVPLYEVVPIELIIDRCWVLDTTTYCKGRPVDSVEDHVYICELRVDKSARLFSKVSKQSNPVCTKSYAFKKFKQKLKISKSYAPHDHPPARRGTVPVAGVATNNAATTTTTTKKEKKKNKDVPIASRKNSTSIVQLRPPPPKTLQEKRQRLDATLTKLMAAQKARNPSASEMDLSYLLTGRGARTKSSRVISHAVTSIT